MIVVYSKRFPFFLQHLRLSSCWSLVLDVSTKSWSRCLCALDESDQEVWEFLVIAGANGMGTDGEHAKQGISTPASIVGNYYTPQT